MSLNSFSKQEYTVLYYILIAAQTDERINDWFKQKNVDSGFLKKLENRVKDCRPLLTFECSILYDFIEWVLEWVRAMSAQFSEEDFVRRGVHRLLEVKKKLERYVA